MLPLPMPSAQHWVPRRNRVERCSPAVVMAEQPAPTGASILLVDDNEDNLLALEAVLERLGSRLVRASSGAEALAAVEREEFALVVLDVQMPGMDGFQTARLLKARRAEEPTPIIFLTANS